MMARRRTHDCEWSELGKVVTVPGLGELSFPRAALSRYR